MTLSSSYLQSGQFLPNCSMKASVSTLSTGKSGMLTIRTFIVPPESTMPQSAMSGPVLLTKFSSPHCIWIVSGLGSSVPKQLSTPMPAALAASSCDWYCAVARPVLAM